MPETAIQQPARTHPAPSVAGGWEWVGPPPFNAAPAELVGSWPTVVHLSKLDTGTRYSLQQGAYTHGTWLKALSDLTETEPIMIVLTDPVIVSDQEPNRAGREGSLNALFAWVSGCVTAFEERWGMPDWRATEQPTVAALPDASDAISKLRRSTQLPVKDVAAMLGIKRRHVYNLLEGEPASAATISRVHAASEMVEQLSNVVGSDPLAVRNALLVPVGGHSLFERLVEGDVDVARRTLSRLVDRLSEGFVLPSSVPASARGSDTRYDDVKDTTVAELLPGES